MKKLFQIINVSSGKLRGNAFRVMLVLSSTKNPHVWSGFLIAKKVRVSFNIPPLKVARFINFPSAHMISCPLIWYVLNSIVEMSLDFRM